MLIYDSIFGISYVPIILAVAYIFNNPQRKKFHFWSREVCYQVLKSRHTVPEKPTVQNVHE